MKEGGEASLCDFSSFTERRFILKPLIYRFSPQFKSSEQDGGRRWRGCEVALCKRKVLRPPSPPQTVSQSVWLRASLRSSALVGAVLWHVRQAAPRGCHRNCCVALPIWRCGSSPTPVHHEAMSRGSGVRKKKKCRVKSVTPEPPQLLHCCAAAVCFSDGRQRSGKWFRCAVATFW